MVLEMDSGGITPNWRAYMALVRMLCITISQKEMRATE